MELDLEKKIQTGEFPSIIYKFRLWDDEPNDHIIRKRTIRLASPSEMLADYPEASLPVDEALITEENLQKFALHTAQLQYPHEHRSFQEKEAQRLRSIMRIEDPEHRREAEYRASQRNDEVLGIFCSSIDFEDVYLWQTFAGLGTGFVVGLYTRKIVLHPLISGSAGLVEYYPTGNPPKLSPFSYNDQERTAKSLTEIFNIPDKYVKEKEFRIARTNRKRDNHGRIAKYAERDRIIQLGQDCYREILLGYDISNSDKSGVIDSRDRNLPGVPIYLTEIINDKVIKKQVL
ncbi:MAG TPA: hypothetical protein VFF29_04675 [Bacteroidota bacterium]|nr:hypothetical protein [Bacteroidota bacterium]